MRVCMYVCMYLRLCVHVYIFYCEYRNYIEFDNENKCQENGAASLLLYIKRNIAVEMFSFV